MSFFWLFESLKHFSCVIVFYLNFRCISDRKEILFNSNLPSGDRTSMSMWTVKTWTNSVSFLIYAYAGLLLETARQPNNETMWKSSVIFVFQKESFMLTMCVCVCSCLASSWQGIFRMTSEANQLAVWLIQAFTAFTRSTSSDTMSFGVFFWESFFRKEVNVTNSDHFFFFLCNIMSPFSKRVWAYCLKFFSHLNCKMCTDKTVSWV